MARSFFAIALVVCALVVSSIAAVDSITLDSVSGVTVTPMMSWSVGGSTYTYNGANPVSISVTSGNYTALTSIIFSQANAMATITAAAGTASSTSISFNAGGGSLSMGSSVSATFFTVSLGTGSSLSIPALSTLTLTSLIGQPTTLTVLGKLSVGGGGISFNNILTPTIGPNATISSPANVALTFPNPLTTTNFQAGGVLSASTGGITITTVGGTFAGNLIASGGGAVQIRGTLTSDLTVSSTVSASSGGININPNGGFNVAVSGALSASGSGPITITCPSAPSVVVGGTVSTSGALQITGNAATTITLSANTTALMLNIASSANSAVVTLSGPATFNNGQLQLTASGTGSSIVVSSVVAGANVVFFSTPGSISIPASGSISFTSALSLGGTTAGGIAIAGMLLGSTTTSTATVTLNPTGALTISGTVTSGTASNSLRLNAGAASSITGTLQSASNIVFGLTGAGAFGSTTYSINGATLNFATSIHFNSPTSFNGGVTFTTPSWSAVVSGGSAIAGPSSTYDLTASANTINSSLFPSGTNTNCVWVQSYTGGSTVSSFLVSLPGNIQYRNWVSASSSALQVSSTNGGTVSFCTPNIQSTLDRRNDPNSNNLVYFGGNVIFYFTTSQALPFGTITASDFTVTGGVITSFTAVGTSKRAVSAGGTVYQIVVQITCDGVVSLAYNGSWTGNGTFLGEVTIANNRIVSAKCISNLYAPCS